MCGVSSQRRLKDGAWVENRGGGAEAAPQSVRQEHPINRLVDHPSNDQTLPHAVVASRRSARRIFQYQPHPMSLAILCT